MKSFFAASVLGLKRTINSKDGRKVVMPDHQVIIISGHSIESAAEVAMAEAIKLFPFEEDFFYHEVNVVSSLTGETCLLPPGKKDDDLLWPGIISDD